MSKDIRIEITSGKLRLSLMYQKTGLPKNALLEIFEATIQELESGRTAEEIVRDLEATPFKVPEGRSSQFFFKLATSMARYAQAAWLISIGNELEAWKAIYCASLDHGSAMAIHIASLERTHLLMTKSKKGGTNRGAKNEELKTWVLAEYRKRTGMGAYEAGTKLALRFEQPYGNPEMKLAEFGAKLSKNNLAKTFGNWIDKEFFPVGS